MRWIFTFAEKKQRDNWFCFRREFFIYFFFPHRGHHPLALFSASIFPNQFAFCGWNPKSRVFTKFFYLRRCPIRIWIVAVCCLRVLPASFACCLLPSCAGCCLPSRAGCCLPLRAGCCLRVLVADCKFKFWCWLPIARWENRVVLNNELGHGVAYLIHCW